jgi:uncharacterized RDD family membrane protein YckC
MTDHQLSYCSVCTKKQFDAREGIVCSLTGRKPDFENACPTFDALPGADLSLVGKPRAFLPESVGIGKRLVNLLIDTAVYYALVFAAAFTLFTFLAIVSPDLVDELIPDDDRTPLWAYLFAFVVFIFYYTVMEAGLGRTVGKLVTGTRVVDVTGRKPSLEIAFKRSIARVVPFEAFSFLGAEARGWHDRWTETYVINNDTAIDTFSK